MRTQLCGLMYPRPNEEILKCQYILDHPSDRHSWYTVQLQDVEDALATEQRAKAKSQIDDRHVETMLQQIEQGFYDSFIEAILNVTHNRKKAIRNVRGFPNLERRDRGRRGA